MRRRKKYAKNRKTGVYQQVSVPIFFTGVAPKYWLTPIFVFFKHFCDFLPFSKFCRKICKNGKNTKKYYFDLQYVKSAPVP